MPKAFGALSFSGISYPALQETPPASTGLESVYILYSTQSATANFEANTANVTVYKFNALGGGYAQEIPTMRNGNNVAFMLEPTDMGYIVEDGTTRKCYWVTDYAKHPYAAEAISKSDDSDCSTAALNIKGTADRITYYSINGAPQTLDRGIIISYNTLEYNDGQQIYASVIQTQEFAYLSPVMQVPAPLCATSFSLSGDKFLEQWNMSDEIQSPVYEPWKVDARTTATQTEHEADNEQSSGIAGLGGSAPCEITFTATSTDAAIFNQWQMSSTSTFDDIDKRFNELVFTYTFTEQGVVYVRFVAGNDDGSCEYIGETYEINIGESALLCPNAFSPGASEGCNDEWKVSYKSIVEFECHIFNRWGQKLVELKTPQQGWDGKYKGKIVPSGVYYYVIKAKGSDGRKYNLSGDINIINYTNSQPSSNAQ